MPTYLDRPSVSNLNVIKCSPFHPKNYRAKRIQKAKNIKKLHVKSCHWKIVAYGILMHICGILELLRLSRLVLSCHSLHLLSAAVAPYSSTSVLTSTCHENHSPQSNARSLSTFEPAIHHPRTLPA